MPGDPPRPLEPPPFRRVPAWIRPLLFALLGIPLLSCSQPTPSPAPESRELRLPLPRDIRSLDPAEGNEITTFNVIRLLYEGLVDHDPRTLAVAPRIARSWSTSGDGLSWTFDLRGGVRFRDDPCFPGGRGREVTAGDVKYSLERGIRRAAAAGRAESLPILGVLPFLAGEAGTIEGILARDPLRLVIRLTRPDPLFLHELAHPRFRILPREAVEAYGEDLRFHAVGTGPFRIVSWEPVSGILLVRNLDYWGRDEQGEALPLLDALRFVPMWRGDENQLYARGKIDMVYSYSRAIGVPGSGPDRRDRPRESNATGIEQQYFVSRLNTIYVRFDFRSSHPAVRSRRLRRALAYGVFRPKDEMHVAAAGLLPPGLPGHDPELAGQRTDPPVAERILREEGHAGGAGLPPLRLAWPDWDGGAGRRIAASLRQLGLDVELALHPGRDFRGAVERGAADLFRAGWIADYPDPQTFLDLFRSDSPENIGAYSNPDYDRLFERLRSEADAGARVDVAREAERILVDDAAALFLHHERESQFVSARVENWEGNCTNALNVCYYERVRVGPGRRGGSP